MMISRNNRMLFTSVLLVAFLFAVVYLFGMSFDGDRHIRFNGSFVLLDQEQLSDRVESLSDKHKDKNVFQSEVEKFLSEEKLIKKISIRYAWPRDVIINIDEVIPVALLGEGELLTDDCQIINYPSGDKDRKFIRFDLGLIQELDFTCRQIKKIIPYVGFEGIQNIIILDNGNFQINYNETDYFLAGHDVPYEINRMQRISTAFRKKGLSVSGVDLRYISGGAILPL